MAKLKKVGFNFFRPIVKIHSGEDKLFNFTEIFEDIRKEYIKAKERIESGVGPREYKLIYSYNNEPARLTDISVDVETQYYHLVFDRLDYQVPNRTTLHGEPEALDLEDDEYIGIDVNVLYDSVNHIFMIQRNRSSLGPSGIEVFLRSIITGYDSEFNADFNLAIVSDNTAKKRALKQASYRKIHLKITGFKANGILEKLTGKNDKVDVDSVEISFNSKSTRDGKIDNDFATEILEEYIDDEEVLKLQIRSRETDDGIVEPIDLIDHKLQTFIEFDFKTDRQLNPITAFQRMMEKFDEGGFKNKVLRM